MTSQHIYRCGLQKPSPLCAKVTNTVAQIILDLKPSNVLDVGCGSGVLIHQLASQGISCVGLEPSTASVEKAKQRCNELTNCTFHNISCYEDSTSIVLGNFDVVVATEVIEHLYNPKQFVEFSKHFLAPTGTLVLSTPDYGSYWRNLLISLANRWDHHHSPLWDGGHIKFFSRYTLTQLLMSQGFQDIHFQGVPSLKVPFTNACLICKAHI